MKPRSSEQWVGNVIVYGCQQGGTLSGSSWKWWVMDVLFQMDLQHMEEVK
jgi:hypothetical protein